MKEKNTKSHKLRKTLLKITKYTFIVFIILSLFLFSSLVVYSKKLDYRLPETVEIKIYNNENEEIVNLNNSSNRSYVRIENISPNIITAFLSIEDKDYYEHQGVNIRRIIGALIADIRNKNLSQGGSTITQQYVKNTFLNSSKTLKRKIDEALIAIHLETKYTKEEILEAYLNTIYFDHGLSGINDACLFYFNKEPKDLTLAEAAVLASIPKSPSNYSPIKNPENNNKRKELILLEIYNDGKITLDEYNEVLNEKVNIYGNLDSIEVRNAPYFQDLVINKLKDMEIPLNKGLKVYTTVDNKLNTLIENAIDKYYDPSSNLELAIVAMDTKGNVLANIGGKDYLKSTYNRTNSLRQPGSTIKSFLYYAAIKNGFNVSHTFNSSPTTFYTEDGIYAPGNYGEIYPNQDVSMIYAIATSDNIYAVKTHLFLGKDVLYNTLIDFGFTSKLNKNSSLALGTSEVTLSELTLGYTKIASLGKDVQATYITKITDLEDNIIYHNDEPYEQKYDYNTCYLLSEALTNVFDNNIRINISPTCASIRAMLSSTYAAKSGSTDFDGWMIGYNKDIVLGIWTGYDDNSIVINSDTKYIKYIWASIMQNYNKSKKNTWYKTPPNIIGIKLNPITGSISHFYEYKKYLYYHTSNLPDFIY